MRKGEELSEAAEVVVLGGGVVGLSIARELARRGIHVTLVERGRLGQESSDAAAGMLAPQSEADGDDEFFRLQCASRDLYPAFAEALRAETGVDVELDRTGTLYLAFGAEEEAELERRYSWQRRAGLSVERLAASDARALEPAIARDVRLALRFPGDWQVENRRLVAALAASVENYGVRILTGTEAFGVRIESGRVTGLDTSRGFISSPQVVVAAGAWTTLLRRGASSFNPSGASSLDQRDAVQDPGEAGFDAQTRIEPVRGQMLCFDARPPLVRHVVYTARGYVVPRRDGRLLAGSTTERAGFDKSVTGAGLQQILAHALEIAPGIGQLPLVSTWAGLRPCAADEWPVLGASEEARGLFYATGHYRNGILLAPLTANLMGELIAHDHTSNLLDAFSPERFRRAAV